MNSMRNRNRQKEDLKASIKQYQDPLRIEANAKERDINDNESLDGNINLSLACECGQSFSTTETLKCHIISAHNTEYKGSIANLSKRRRFRLSDKSKLDQKQQQTEYFSEKPARKKYKHSYQLVNGQARCSCGQSFKTPKEYYSHRNKAHPQINDQQKPANNNENSEEQNEKYIQGANFNLSKGSKQYYSTRIFMCGSCELMFVYEEQIRVHLRSIHSGVMPEGTIYGVRKDRLLKYFHIPFEKSVYLYDKYKDQIFCGCGKKYTSTSSLAFHVMHDHRGIAPENTIGLPRRMRVSTLDGQVQ